VFLPRENDQAIAGRDCLIEAISNSSARICMVGDPHQPVDQKRFSPAAPMPLC